MSAVARVREQTVQAHAHRLGLDLLRIGRADRRDGVGEEESGLEKRKAAVVFDAVDGEAGRGQSELGDPCGAKLPWNARLWIVMTLGVARAEGKRGVRRRKSGLPVVRVNDLRAPRDGTLRRSQPSRDVRQQAEAQRIVLPIDAARVLVRPAVAIVERRAIDDPRRNAAGATRPRAGALREARAKLSMRAALRAPGSAASTGRYPGSSTRASSPIRRSAIGSAPRDVAEPAGLDQRRAFRRCVEYAKRSQGQRRADSIAGRVHTGNARSTLSRCRTRSNITDQQSVSGRRRMLVFFAIPTRRENENPAAA